MNFIVLAILIYRLAIFAGTAYLVGWHGWSWLWFLVAFCAASIEMTATGKEVESS